MHHLNEFNEKIMTSQIKQHCWKGMCVGGKGVMEAADKDSAWKLDNEEVVELHTNGLQTSLGLVFVLAFATPCNMLSSVLFILHLVLNQDGTFPLLVPSVITTAAPALLPR